MMLVAGISLLLQGAAASADLEYRFPPGAGVLDVKRDFGARGDGTADDTRALQAAIVAALSGDGFRNPRFIYLPEGTYLLSDSLKARITDKPDGQGGWSDGWRPGLALIGQSRARTILKLKDRCPGFGDPEKPRAVLITGSTGHGTGHDRRIGGWGNEAFRNTLFNFTVDVGRGNPGAVGVDFLASNRGALEEVTIRSGDPAGTGFCGVDMSRPWPGPALVKNVAVEGFDVGIRQKSMDCSMTYEHVTLSGQRVCAVDAVAQPFMSLRGVRSRNAVPVFRVQGPNAVLNILDSLFTFTGAPGAEVPPAIAGEGHILLKNVTVEGYPTVLAPTAPPAKGAPPPAELKLPGGKGRVAFFTSRPPFRLSPGPEQVPDLPVKETPTFHHGDFRRWALPAASARGSRTSGIQEAIDSGAEIVFLPNGHYPVSETIVLRGAVRKILGGEAFLAPAKGVTSVDPLFRFDGPAGTSVILEHLRGADRSNVVEHNGAGTLVLRHCDLSYRNTPRGTGDAFLEDGMFDHPAILFPQRLWARQLNSEFGRVPNFTNRGGTAWILGMKVEGHVGAILNIGGVTECYALYAITNQNGTAPFVENREGWMAVSFREGGQKGHRTKVRETWEGESRPADTWQREFCLVLTGRPFDPAASRPRPPAEAVGKAPSSDRVELSWKPPAVEDRLGLSHYRIERDGTPVGSAPAETPSFADAGLSEKRAYLYEIRAVNLRGGVSEPARVRVVTPADTVPPRLARAEAHPEDLSRVILEFDEPMDPASAGTPASYALTPAVPVTRADPSGDGRRVLLTTAAPLEDGKTYTLSCRGLKDRSSAGHALANPSVSLTAWARGDGLHAEFWNDKESFAGKPVFARRDRRIDFWWGDGSPAPGVTPGAFSARWTGYLRPTESGEYRFHAGAVSGCRILLDGKVLHDAWNGKPEWTWSPPVQLEAGRRYPFVFEMHAVAGQAGARLKWKGPRGDLQFLDEDVLFSPDAK